MHAFNNVIYNTISGNSLGMTNDAGTLNLHHNWIKTNWVNSRNGPPSGSVNDQGNNLSGTDPLFSDFSNQDFSLQNTSALINSGTAIPAIHLPNHDLLNEYVKHTSSIAKQVVNALDIGVFEYQASMAVAENSLGKLVLYPNPSATWVRLKNIKPNAIQSVAFYAVDGQLLLTSTDTVIDVSGLGSGIYFVKVKTSDSQAVIRFIKP